MDRVDVAIIGAGVVGLSAAYALAEPGKSVLVVERNKSFGEETSSRNSEVIHAGLYYKKNSLKSRLCVEGARMVYELCDRYNIGHRRLGKILISRDSEEEAKLIAIYENALTCGVEGVRFLCSDELCKLEPDVRARTAFISENTGIVDSHGFMSHLYLSAKSRGVDFAFGIAARRIDKVEDGYKVEVTEPDGGVFCFECRALINCAGLMSDKVALMAGLDLDRLNYRIRFCKGQYFRIRNPKKYSITHLIYPPPTDIGLGIHITPDLAGGLRLGPDAKYVEDLEYCVDEKERAGFLADTSTFVNGLSIDDLIPDTAGIRPKLASQSAGGDFIIVNEEKNGLPNLINAIGIESPGLTASLAIGRYLKNLILN